MPENDNSIPLDDEDILDLTVVAEPGKTPEAPKPDGPPEPGDSGADFGADLDALLDSLGVDGSVAAPAAAPATAPTAVPTVVPTAAEAVSPAPIADQTPVAHKVDPNEELAMPEMLDIDSLLAELGAEVPAGESKAAPGPGVLPAKPSSAEKEPHAQAPIPEFDSILAQAQAAEARKAEEEAVAVETMPPAAKVAAEDLVPAAPAGEQAPVAAEAGPQPEVPEHAARESAQDAAQDAAREAAPPAEDPEENIDLNELDALLDDILATAPEMSVAAPSVAAPAALRGDAAMETAAAADVPPEAAEAPAPVAGGAPEILPVPDQAIMPVAEDVAALAARVQRLEEAEDIAALMTRVQRLEEAVDALEAGKMSETMIEGLIAAKLEAGIAAMFEPGSPVMDRIVTELMGRMAGGAFNESLEKMAAAAAAKVIREEIAALMQENG